MSTRYRSFKYPLAPDGGPASAQNALALEQHLELDSWHDATLLNSWVVFGSTFSPPRYRKTLDGIVHLEGLVKSGTVTAGTPVLYLPEGYRPPYDIIIVGMSTDAVHRTTVRTDGQVQTGIGWTNTYASLHLSFAT